MDAKLPAGTFGYTYIFRHTWTRAALDNMVRQTPIKELMNHLDVF